MAWTEPITWSNVLSDASDFNEQIRDNLLALKQPPTAHYEANQGSNYSTSGTWANIDGTNWSYNFTSEGGDLLLGFIGSFNTSTGAAVLDVLLDGSRIKNSVGGIAIAFSNNGFRRCSFLYLVQNVAAGAHTISLQWQLSSSPTGSLILYAGAGTANYDLHPRFWVREIS